MGVITEIRRFAAKALSSVPAGRSGGGWYRVGESSAGAWQSGIVIDQEGAMRHPFVFRCQTMIARDIAKLRLKLVKLSAKGVWSEDRRDDLVKLLQRPNGYQNAKQFFESYFLSKLARGNTYVYIERSAGGDVLALHVLDPLRVQPLVSDSGAVFYRVSSDNLAALPSDLIIPASEVIHDRWNCLFHPLVGLSPLWASALAAQHGEEIAKTSANFFKGAAQPSGLISAPAKIGEEDAKRLQEAFSASHSGAKAGRVAVVSDGLTFTPMSMSAVDSELILQVRITNETIATVYGVPHYKLGIGQMPAAANIEALNIEYYSQTLQGLIEEAEAAFDLAFNFDGVTEGFEFATDDLIRMDSATQMAVLEKGRSVMKLNERRKRLDLEPIDGGDTVFMQQQDHSIDAIKARDLRIIEGKENPPAVPAPPALEPRADDPESDKRETKALLGLISVKLQKGARDARS